MATIPCVCPPKADGTPRHETDTVTLRERLDFLGGLAARNSLAVLAEEDPEASTGEKMAAMAPTFLVYGIESWTLVDEKGKKVEV